MKLLASYILAIIWLKCVGLAACLGEIRNTHKIKVGRSE
jgi:hypothetical protein